MKKLDQILKPSLLEQIKKENATEPEESGLHPDVYLFNIWDYRIPKGWYGFSLTDAVPFSWALAIDALLKEIEIHAPDFEIHQIKLKFGRLRFYIATKVESDELNDAISREISALEALLCHPRFMY